MTGLVLFRRETCGLCELAEDVLRQAGVADIAVRYLEDDPALEAVYGWRIPVIRDETRGIELDWPFDGPKLQAFLGLG